MAFILDFEQPYRVPVGGVVTPPITISVKDKVLNNPAYRLEATGIAQVDESGRSIHGLQRGTTSVRVVYPTPTGTPDTTFEAQVVVSRVSVAPYQHTLTRLQDSVQMSGAAFGANDSLLSNVSFRWFSSDTSVAKVSQAGVARAVDEGWATISAEVDSVLGVAGLTVVQVASAVSLSPQSDTLRTVRRSTRFAALAFDSTGHVITPAKPRWSSSDPNVAAVDATGLVTATGAGTSRIVARVGVATDTATLVVAQVVRHLFVLPAFDTLTAIDDTIRLGALATDSEKVEISSPTVTWASSDTTIVTVDQSGLLRAIRNGAVVVTASSGRHSAFATVVVRQAVVRVRLPEDSVALSGKGTTLHLQAEGVDQNGYLVDGAVFYWRNLSPLLSQFVAAVDSTGLVTALGDGVTYVMVTSGDAKPDTAAVTVTDAPQQDLIAFESRRGIEVVRSDGSLRTVLIPNFEDRAEPYGLEYRDPAWSPDGTRLALTQFRWDWGDCVLEYEGYGGCWDVYTVSVGGSDLVNLTPGVPWDIDDQAAWSPEGTKVAFRSSRAFDGPCCNNGIYVVNADGSNLKQLTHGADGNPAKPAWSPDGNRVAFEQQYNDGYGGIVSEIYVMNSDGSGAVNLTNRSGNDYQPAWSPDGARLAFVSTRDNGDDIWVMNTDGTAARNLTSGLVFDGKRISMFQGSPTWSPDGSRIAFVGIEEYCRVISGSLVCSWLDERAYLYIMRSDGTNVRRLTSTSSEGEWRPTWRVAAPLQAVWNGPRRHPGPAR